MFLKSRPSSELSEHSLFSIENIYLPDLNLSSSKANGAEFALLGRNYLRKSNAIRTTVLYREMGTGQMGTNLGICLSSPVENRNSLAWVLPTNQASFVYSRGITYTDISDRKSWLLDTENRGACALTRARMTIYDSQFRSGYMQLGLSLAKPPRLGPSSPVQNGNSLACLPG